jgi:hypothetical protein
LSTGERVRELSRLARVVLCAVICALLSPALARAHEETVVDGNDRPGVLDVRSTSVSHTRNAVRHTITTFQGWSPSLIDIRKSPINYLAIGFDVSGDSAFDRYLIFLEEKGHLRGFWTTRSGLILTTFRASRPNRRTVSVLIPSYTLQQGGGYYWAAVSVLHRNGRTVVDRAPNQTVLLHDLVPPKVDVTPLTWDISTFMSDTTSIPVEFTVGEPARSSGLSWRLERRESQETAWETMDSGNGEGPKTAALTGADGGNYVYRVVATDGQGNTTSGARWRLSFPTDDANALFASSYGGTWSTTPLGDPYLGTLHSTSTPGATFTYAFNVTHRNTDIIWIGPLNPGGGGQASLALDGNSPFAVVQAGPDADRTILWQGSDPAFGPHTLTITNVSGTIAIDGLIIR